MHHKRSIISGSILPQFCMIISLTWHAKAIYELLIYKDSSEKVAQGLTMDIIGPMGEIILIPL